MPRRRSSRSLAAGLRALLPAVPRLPSLPPVPAPPAPVRRPRVAAPRPRRAPKPSGSGRWVTGLHSGPAGTRSYEVYLPAGLRRRTRAPLLVLLHGCRQSPREIADASRFLEAADRNGFVVVLPQQQAHHHAQRCWRWYDPAHQHRGAGEPAIIAGIAQQVAAEVARWRIDPRRVYAAGLSAGGAMALTLAATYPDVVAAVGVHSAPAYRSAQRPAQALAAMAGRTDVPPPAGTAAMAPAVVVQGGSDPVVRPANAARIAAQWLAFHAAGGGDAASVRTRTATGRTADGRRYTVQRWYIGRGRKVLEQWVVDGLGHAWSGGRRDGSYSDPAGPRAATLMWTFLRAHQLERRARPAGVRAAGA